MPRKILRRRRSRQSFGPATVRTDLLKPNPHNPRMLFDPLPLKTLEDSIRKVGILVPLTVFRAEGSDSYTILDGQRRWICAQNIELPVVPINEVPEPTTAQNIVTMFQIHKLRQDWELMPTALKLDCVEVISDQEILVGYRKSLGGLAAWNVNPARRKGRWFFVGFGRSGESGQAMLRPFREANQMTSAMYDNLFCSATELPSKKLTATDHVVFVDDFSGSGRQISLAWPTLQELIASEAKCHLILTAATERAIQSIRKATGVDLNVHIILEDEDNIFSARCHHFSPPEKAAIERYSRRADGKIPRGFGQCGLLFVLSHKTPNNTIPLLHAYHDRWHGLFPRYVPLPN